eukprot:1140344-Pelagomonas_calceolata.AAC.2
MTSEEQQESPALHSLYKTMLKKLAGDSALGQLGSTRGGGVAHCILDIAPAVLTLLPFISDTHCVCPGSTPISMHQFVKLFFALLSLEA